MMNTQVFNTIELRTPYSIISKQPKHLSLSFSFKPISSKPTIIAHRALRWSIKACAAEHEIDMVRNKQGVYTAKSKKVVVLWDLDNKPPRGPPYQVALELKRVAQKFGDVVDMSAYANRHAFIHLPQWVLDERRERRRLDILERKGAVTPAEAYVCSVCGRKCKTNLDLKKHFKQLHERERQKKLNRMSSLKGKKRQRYKERFLDGNHKYTEAARSFITPKEGYGLGSELRRAGVFVKTVADKPQAADLALKRQMQHSMSRGVDWVMLVSDDSDFSEMLKGARLANLGTVVVGDWDRTLGRHADFWVPWTGVEKGEITDKDLVLRKEMRSLAFSEREDFGVGEEYDEEEDWLQARLNVTSDKGFEVGESIDSEDDDYILDYEDEESDMEGENF